MAKRRGAELKDPLTRQRREETLEERCEAETIRLLGICGKIGLRVAKYVKFMDREDAMRRKEAEGGSYEPYIPGEDFRGLFHRYAVAVIRVRDSQRQYEAEQRKRLAGQSDKELLELLEKATNGKPVYELRDGTAAPLRVVKGGGGKR